MWPLMRINRQIQPRTASKLSCIKELLQADVTCGCKHVGEAQVTSAMRHAGSRLRKSSPGADGPCLTLSTLAMGAFVVTSSVSDEERRLTVWEQIEGTTLRWRERHAWVQPHKSCSLMQGTQLMKMLKPSTALASLSILGCDTNDLVCAMLGMQ